MHTATFSFTDEYNKLNPAQKQAVETTEGPVLVVAGPGTGKTQILAARIGNILDKGLAFAENILCLTYTEAGVTAMRKRLIKFIGAEAYKVNIHTFHSFCNKVIQDNPDTFGFGEMESISDIEEIELLEKLIDTFSKDNPLKRWRGQIYYDVPRLKNLFSIMKRENLNAAKVEKAVDWYLENEYPNQKGVIAGRKITGTDNVVYQKGELRLDKVAQERTTFETTIAAAKEFENYQKLKKEASRYDYDDMILDVMHALQNNEWLLSRYQEQFQYFLVDEYQDTNGAQNEILRLLYSYWETPNIFVVGDDDQSIYRFQGANLENIIHFYQDTIGKLAQEEQEQRIIVLKQNYRSTQEILNLAANCIENNKDRLVNQIKTIALDKTLSAAGDIAKENKVQPKLVVYPNPSHEVADIANQIIALSQNGVPLNEIGVLYIQHKQATELQQCLNQKNIPVSTKKSVDILNERFTNMLLDILTYIVEENRIPHSREDLLFNMMHFPFFDIKAIQIARLSFELRESRYSKPKTTWREALLNLEKIFDEESLTKIHAIAELTNKWQKDLQEFPVQLFFQSILDDLHALDYVKQHREKVWLLQELKTLFDFVKEENQKKPNMSLSEFLETIQQLRNYSISIPFVKSSYAEEAVQLSSVHGSKGLEYSYVFLIGCVSNLWETKRARSSTFRLPDGMFQKVDSDSKFEDLRRLFFVAITRAKQHLQISYYNEDLSGKDLTPSLFVTDIKENENLMIQEMQLDDEAIFEFNILQLMQEKISPELIEENMLKKRLEKYSMSVTHLNNYLECPLKFYYHNFIQIPQAKNASLAFGSAVHDAIEGLFKEMKAQVDVFPSVEEFIDLGKKQLYKQQDSFTKKEYNQKLEYLEKFFPEYYNTYVAIWNKNVNFEKKLVAVFKDINLTGKLDKIEFDGKDITIVDYKTGQYKSDKKKLFLPPSEKYKKPEDPTHEEKHGGNYWRQAVFYKILIDFSITTSQRDWHLIRTEFDFVEPNPNTGDFHKEKIIITPNDLQIVQNQITNTWQNIKALNFDGCGKEDCQWCAGELEKQEEDV
jgi:DNA helicase II / ATP-dependent DNA helicase PcrA